MAKIDEACIARGLLVRATCERDDVLAGQHYCERSEQAVRRAITAYARAIRRAEIGTR